MTTATQTKVQPYTHHAYVNSSAIDEVFYDDVDQKLFVQLLSGSVAAYRDVPLSVFTALVNPRNSAGAYWNQEVKPCYQGISSDVDLRQRDTLPPLLPQGQAYVTSNPVDLTTSFQSKPATSLYVVQVEVQATSLVDAATKAEVLGRVVSVTA